MIRILLVYNDQGLTTEFVNAIGGVDDTEITTTDNGNNALEFVQNTTSDIAIIAETLPDMTGIELVERVVKVNPMVNTAVVSDLHDEAFHEATEGLGILMAIPSKAGKTEASNLITYLGTIMNVTL